MNREEFFKNCKYITKAPASIFIEGDRFSKKAKLLPIPLYAYAGIENGNFKKFEYEEITNDDKEGIHEDPNIISLNPSFLNKNDRAIYIPMFFEKFKRFFIYKKIVYPAMFGKENFNETSRKWEEIEKGKKKVKFDYFKIKVWSEIPYNIALNEASAIATAIGLLLALEFYPSGKSKNYFKIFNDLRTQFPEGAVADSVFINIFTRGWALDFFSNGATVFAALLGMNHELKIIDYECLIYNEFKKFFSPYSKTEDIPVYKSDKEFPINSINEYSKQCTRLFFTSKDYGFPAFRWDYSELFSEPDEKVSISIIRKIRKINDGPLEYKDVKCQLISPFSFILSGSSSAIVACEMNPGKFIFGKSEDPFEYDVIYNSRKQGWGSKGAEVIYLEKLKDTERIKPPEPEEKIKKPTLELGVEEGRGYVKVNGIPISQELTKPEILLLNELVLRNEIPWCYGFICFHKWQKGVKNPKAQFRVVVSRLNKKIGHEAIVLKKMATGLWCLNKNLVIKSYLEELKERYESINKESREGKHVIDKITDMLKTYPECIEGVELLAKVKRQGIEIPKELELDAYQLISSKENNLKEAIRCIQKHGETAEWEGIWEEAKPHLEKLVLDYEKLCDYLDILTKPSLKIVEKEVDVANMAESIKKKDNVCSKIIRLIKLAGEGKPKETCDNPFFQQLVTTDEIKDIFKKVVAFTSTHIKNLGMKVTTDEIRREALLCLWNFVMGKPNLEDIKEWHKLRAYLTKTLQHRTKESITEMERSTPSYIQRDIRKFVNVRNKLAQKLGYEPSEKEILAELCWSEEQLDRIKIYTSSRDEEIEKIEDETPDLTELEEDENSSE